MTAPAAPDRRRTGRPVGSPPNRESILAAAREQFAARGYDSATIRGIAAVAGVDPALVHHYFGSKDQLFVAAVQLPVNPSELVPQLLAGGVEGLGERLTRRFLEIWDPDETGGASGMVGMIRSAATHEASARLVREFFAREVLERIAEALDVPQPQLRAALVGSQLVGLAMFRFVVRVEPIASADPEALIACYAPLLQHLLTDPPPCDGG
jgi:AcrR family transcriptional regulator